MTEVRDESERQRSLDALEVLDTPPDREFDALVRAAALVCGTPIALISLIDGQRQWFKANEGLDGVSETPREQAFCAHAIQAEGLMEVPDALDDPRFASNPLVLGQPGIRFYAGAPLRLDDGAAVGTLCIIDRMPRVLSAHQRAVLGELATAAVQALQRHRVAADLRRSEARFRALGESAPLGVFTTDAGGALTYTNDRWQAIFGLEPAQSVDRAWLERMHPEDREATAQAWQASVAGCSDFEAQCRLVDADRGLRHVRVVARPVSAREAARGGGHVGSVEDITQRLEDVRVLREERRRLASILEGTDVGTWEWNVATGQLRFNERWATMLGHTLEALAPLSFETFRRLTHPDDMAQCERQLARHFDGLEAAYECELRMRHRDGHWVWVLDRGRVLSRHADGKPRWMFGTHLDITRRKHDEDELRRLAEALKEADQRKNEFLATLAHELRNPLAPLRTGLHVLQRAALDGETAQRTRLMMNRQLVHLVHLVDDLLDISRVDSGKVSLSCTRTDLREVIAHAREQCQPLIDAARHTLRLRLPDEPMWMQADAMRLAQVVGNLLNNAAKYTPAGGQLALSVVREDGMAVVTVRDNGVGIPAEALPKVFDIFMQVREHAPHAQGGLGIGLSLAQRLVELHGGSIAAWSAGRGAGSTFTVRLPLTEAPIVAPALAPTAQDGPAPASNASALRVLVVDDNVDAATSLAMLLELEGHEVLVMHEGRAALARALDFAPRVAIVDLNMPVMDGWEVATGLRRLPLPGPLRIVALTGHGSLPGLERFHAAGFDHHLTKPATLEDLQQTLRVD